ncbi:MAG TPA: DegV family protein [Anaerolineales bacterium]|nr:DegV family protein [Anaerolineales bacterium]
MKIVTDCAADLSAEELKELGIEQAPLYIQFPEGEVSSIDISADAFYDRLEAMRPDIPTTAMPSSGLFAEIYRRIAKRDQNIFSLHISSGLSGTINAARAGGEEAKPEANVDFWDTLTLSGGERFQVITAALAAKAGWTLHSIRERLAKIREKTELIYTLDTLDYLARGGRIGRVKAMAGALLRLKPVIRVDTDGKYSTVTTARTIGKGMSAITEHLFNKYASAPLWVTVLHGRFADRAEELARELRDRLNIAKLEVMRISPVLGVHTGPGIVGAAVVPVEVVKDLI